MQGSIAISDAAVLKIKEYLAEEKEGTGIRVSVVPG
jgi:Fe-S cluster assembly iron-binding protein IscA